MPTLAFGPLTIAYDARVLQPRPWTALQGDWAHDLLADAPDGPVLELCTGAGHIGLLAIARNDRHLVAVDASPAACEWARANAHANGLGDRVEVRESALDRALAPGERYAMVIADPPWVPSHDTGRFPEDPLSAIDGGADGLAVARACLAVARTALVPGGALLLQLGDDDQADRLGAEGLVERSRRRGDRGVVVLLERET